MPSNTQAITILKKAVDATSFKDVAIKIGYSVSTIKAVYHGKYNGNMDKVKCAIQTHLQGYPPNYIAINQSLKKLRQIAGQADNGAQILPIINQLEANFLHGLSH